MKPTPEQLEKAVAECRRIMDMGQLPLCVATVVIHFGERVTELETAFKIAEEDLAEERRANGAFGVGA